MQQIEPLQLAVKFNPPKIALVYRNSNQNFIHEIHLGQKQLLAMRTEDLLDGIYNKHPGYFEKVDPMQMLNLLDMLKDEIHGDRGDDLDDLGDRMDSYEEEIYGDHGEIDFELDHDMNYGSDDEEPL
mmetsp:Transcript_26001/g.46018  ORF Transcript_26001/g.46018 Transcript_26001/m.46018 type:complete len:127 (-) Transcript_26001:3865-4245(-)